MADIDLGPLLRAMAQDASRRARVPEPALVRRVGDHRRLGKAVGVGAAVTLVSTTAFGLMSGGGFGRALPVGTWEVAAGSLATLPTWPAASAAPSDVVVPPAPTWNVAPPATPPAAPEAGPPPPAPHAPSSAALPRTSSGSVSSTTTITTTVTVPPPDRTGPTSAARPSTPVTTTPAPTPTTPTSPPASPTPPATSTPPPGGTGTASPLEGPVELWLTDQVGGRIGFPPGTGRAFGDPIGTLPYPARLATQSVTTTLRSTGPTSTAAVGVDQDGQAHLTYFADGKAAVDHVLGKTAWADAVALVALGNQQEGRITVLAFRPDGTAVRQVVETQVPAAVPTLREATVVLRGLAGVSAATHARHDPEMNGAYGSIWAYVVAGDRLLVVRVAVDGTATLTESVASGMTGTTTLARLSTHVPGTGGVAAWTGTGPGLLFFAKDAFGALARAGETAPLPR